MLVQDLRTLSGPTLGQEMLHYSAPLEDLADPGLRGNPVRDLPGRRCGPALTAFLKDPQYGARSVAKEIFRQLSEARRRQFSMATDERTTHGESKVFPELPTDRGHFPRPYFPEVLCGLRTALPGYARDALEGRTVPTGITDKLAGIIFVRI
ncbi:hypothetical protein ACFZBU_38770 [Embleya sp. NPDC008237]|uniref:hypothetical protein n=1 Tax=Embleya sp. NPDC008237 TaxID=3363978 RepID=UPI0036EBDFF1